MTYNEWRDELKSNLLSVSETERRRVLDYYAEAYADRRDAGYSERQIIEDFGAPYDAAQRILLNICDEQEYVEEDIIKNNPQNVVKPDNKIEKSTQNRNKANDNPKVDNTQKANHCKKKNSHPVLYAILCVLLAIPMFVIFVTIVCTAIGIAVAPFAMLVVGVVSIGYGIIDAFSDVLFGLYSIGEGLVCIGLCIVLTPLLIKLVKILWKTLKKLPSWLKGLFGGKEKKYE